MAFKKQARKLKTNLNKFSMLHWGKHIGKTCEEVCNVDPEYILWLGREPHIKLHPDLQVLAEECTEWVNHWDYETYKEMDDVYGL